MRNCQAAVDPSSSASNAQASSPDIPAWRGCGIMVTRVSDGHEIRAFTLGGRHVSLGALQKLSMTGLKGRVANFLKVRQRLLTVGTARGNDGFKPISPDNLVLEASRGWLLVSVNDCTAK